ncbi:menaquinone biosynthesis protein [Alkalihalobacterium bogoriense]|uniref:menaquinone biosynthesis protein n=1 Tax=Alkalihalobacterium bogoriense TaxID=246272 RepID=UPI000687E209|nr:menaquinone biosynthesis protein [Alkalihalobacterium bogoriense]
MTLVVGEISYTNILPLYYYLDRNKLSKIGLSFVPKIPAKLNKDMSEGTVDLGGISSFAYGEHASEYTLLPNLSVSSYRDVGSIFLFSKYPLEQLEGKRVALTSSSATSINLLRIIIKRFVQIDVQYEVVTPNFQHMMSSYDGCLLIGDDAITTSWAVGKEYYRYDLGELWYKYTGYPMTFAVLAVRNEVVKSKSEILEELYEQFLFSKRKSQEDSFLPMIADIRKTIGGTTEYWSHYFQGLSYDFDEKQKEGLLYYYKLAYEQGLLSNKVERILLWNEFFRYHTI